MNQILVRVLLDRPLGLGVGLSSIVDMCSRPLALCSTIVGFRIRTLAFQTTSLFCDWLNQRTSVTREWSWPAFPRNRTSTSPAKNVGSPDGESSTVSVSQLLFSFRSNPMTDPSQDRVVARPMVISMYLKSNLVERKHLECSRAWMEIQSSLI